MASSRQSRKPLFDLNRSDNLFVETATTPDARDKAIKRLTVSRNTYIALLILASLATIWALYETNLRAFAVAFLALVLARLTDVDIRIKVLKVLKQMSVDSGDSASGSPPR
jgi:hypothetical protein